MSTLTEVSKNTVSEIIFNAILENLEPHVDSDLDQICLVSNSYGCILDVTAKAEDGYKICAIDFLDSENEVYDTTKEQIKVLQNKINQEVIRLEEIYSIEQDELRESRNYDVRQEQALYDQGIY